jgi:Zn-dependent protease with chaperone function
MNFFEHQQRAKRNTAWLVLLYCAAVIGILIAVDVLVTTLYAFESGRGARAPFALHAIAILITAAVILGATAYKVVQLASGGDAVAAMVGARRVQSQTADLAERRLVNVVEEMAIASGTAVPAVYVMDDEPAINAFAAGYEPDQAVIAVTRGALEKLNRDELQGVIGHEFSHILNGDMRINVRMMGILFGITCIGSIGRFLTRASDSGSRRRGHGGDGVVALGLGLMAIGFIGVFFARVIKAAVSRQREFLADASSVQFTRNPDGIAGALDRIDASGAGTLVESRYAEELSHMFFGQSVTMWLSGLMDTHPPIEERIKRVHPRFARKEYRGRRAEEDGVPLGGEDRSARLKREKREIEAWGGAAAASLHAETMGTERAGGVPEPSAAVVVASVGNPTNAHVRYAHQLVESIPPMLRMMATEPRGAQALLLALALAADEPARNEQIEALENHGIDMLASLAIAPAMLVRKLGPQYRLPLLDLAAPVLRTLNRADHERLLAALRLAVEADRKVTLEEFVLLTIAEKRLATDAGRAEPVGRATIAALSDDACMLISLLARAGHHEDAWVGLAFERAMNTLRLPGRKLMDISGLDVVRGALYRLRNLAPTEKARFLEAVVVTVMTDEKIHLREAELVRLIASELDLPLPPILAANPDTDRKPPV